MILSSKAWLEPVDTPIPVDLVDEVAGDQMIAAALYRRGVTNRSMAKEFLNPEIPRMDQPYRLPGMYEAVERINSAIQKHERIGVWGDFDVDGQTSTAILVQSLRALGADVNYHIPVRGPESHGITLPFLQDFLSREIRLLLTCDTGISEVAAAEACKQAGVDLIITDHHTLPETLPSAFAVINPHFLPVDDPLYPLCGAGTAFELAKALLTSSSATLSPDLLLDLAALGTLADMASLWGENRYLVKRGLDQLRATNRLAIRSLFDNAKIDPSALNEDHVNFYLAPRLNAVGRLSDANPVVEFLLSQDRQFINTFSLQIEGLNGQRRILTESVESAALRQVEQNPGLLDEPSIILSHPLWTGGVLGLVAGRLASLFQRPVFIFRTDELGIARGSARSIAGVNIIQAISHCSDLLLGFGGHPQAAGLSLRSDDLPLFQRRLNSEIHASHPEGVKEIPLEIEAYLGFSEITSALADRIDRLAPFGQGNPEVLLAARNVEILDLKLLGKNQEHTKLTIRDYSNVVMDVLHWQSNGAEYPGGAFDLAFALKNANYRGKPQVTIEWKGFRQEDFLPLQLSSKNEFEVVDSRQRKVDISEIIDLSQIPGVAVFREGVLIQQIPVGVDRRHAAKVNELVITSSPPDWDILAGLITTALPEKVHVYDLAPPEGSLQTAVAKLAGLVKYAIQRKNGIANITELAIHCAQTEVFVRLGVNFLCTRGDITALIERESTIFLNAPGEKADPRRQKEIENALFQVFQETRAFRDYFRSADLVQLFKHLN